MLRTMVNADLSALQRAWPIIGQVISLLQVRLGGLGAEAKQRWQILHLTRLAESLVRRWLMLTACTSETWPIVGLARKCLSARLGPGYFRRSENSGMTRKVPLFPLYEPERALRLLDDAPEAQGSLPPPAFNPENLKRRCAALSDVIAAPERHIKRMARWLARAAARRKTRFGRMHPLRVGWPPGGSRRQRRLDPDRQGTLSWLDELARQAVLRCASP